MRFNVLYIDGISDEVIGFLNTTIGSDLKDGLRCGGLYGIYQSIFDLVCLEIIDVVHVLWFSIGWTVGMFPIGICAWSLLMKYFRKT